MGTSDTSMHLDKTLCTYDGKRIIEFEGKPYKKGDVPPPGMHWFKDYLVIKEDWMVVKDKEYIVRDNVPKQ